MDEKLLLNSLQKHQEWAQMNIWNVPITLADDIGLAIKIIERLASSPWMSIDNPPIGTKKDTPKKIFVSDGSFVYKAIYHFDGAGIEVLERVVGDEILYWMNIPDLPGEKERTLTEADRKFLLNLQEHADWAKNTTEEVPSDLVTDILSVIECIKKNRTSWIPVEQPPRSDGVPLMTEVLVSDGKDVYEAIYHFHSGNFGTSDVLALQCPITHWMPIPDF